MSSDLFLSKTTSDEIGRYAYHTVKPGKWLAPNIWYRNLIKKLSLVTSFLHAQCTIPILKSCSYCTYVKLISPYTTIKSVWSLCQWDSQFVLPICMLFSTADTYCIAAMDSQPVEGQYITVRFHCPLFVCYSPQQTLIALQQWILSQWKGNI